MRKGKAMVFLQDPATFPKMLIWLAVGRYMVRMHFAFFKAGAHLGSVEGSGTLLNMTKPRESRARRLLAFMGQALHSNSHEELEMFKVMFMWCPVSSWPADLRDMADGAILTVMGNFWRRFVLRLERFPYRLATLTDTMLPEEDFFSRLTKLGQSHVAPKTLANHTPNCQFLSI